MTKIYYLSDPRDPNNIRYIGKTIRELNHRLSIHIAEISLVNKTHKNNWIKFLLNEGIIPTISLIEEINDSYGSEREIYWIRYYKELGFDLTNSTDGGEGMLNPSEETRKKLSKASTGKNNPNYGKKRTKEINDKINAVRVMKHSDETKKILGEKSKGHTLSEEVRKVISEKNKGKKLSEETKLKISESLKGHSLSEETKEKLRNRIISDETKAKLSEACAGEKNGFYGKKHSKETKEKLSKSRKGSKFSEEVKAKMSESRSGKNNSFYGKKHSEETKAKMKANREKKKLEKFKIRGIN